MILFTTLFFNRPSIWASMVMETIEYGTCRKAKTYLGSIVESPIEAPSKTPTTKHITIITFVGATRSTKMVSILATITEELWNTKRRITCTYFEVTTRTWVTY